MISLITISSKLEPWHLVMFHLLKNHVVGGKWSSINGKMQMTPCAKQPTGHAIMAGSWNSAGSRVLGPSMGHLDLGEVKHGADFEKHLETSTGAERGLLVGPSSKEHIIPAFTGSTIWNTIVPPVSETASEYQLLENMRRKSAIVLLLCFWASHNEHLIGSFENRMCLGSYPGARLFRYLLNFKTWNNMGVRYLKEHFLSMKLPTD